MYDGIILLAGKSTSSPRILVSRHACYMYTYCIDGRQFVCFALNEAYRVVLYRGLKADRNSATYLSSACKSFLPHSGTENSQ